jgi:uncharacterized membrane protein YozB (DUF420 family)
VIGVLLVLHLLLVGGSHPKPKHPKVKPKADRLWIYNCRHIGWAIEYPECRLREA